MPASPPILARVSPDTSSPPSTSNVTCTMSVSATAFSPPYNWYSRANPASRYSAVSWSMPAILVTAIEPSQTIEVRLTNTYSASQNTAIRLRMVGP